MREKHNTLWRTGKQGPEPNSNAAQVLALCSLHALIDLFN
jgi:hypothetical protein